MRVYAEQTWGTWDGRADLDPTFDKIIQLDGHDIGLIGVDRSSDVWFLDKLYLLPAYQRQGLALQLRFLFEMSATRLSLVSASPE